MEISKYKTIKKEGIKGNTTVQMAYILPLFFFFFIFIIHTVFYLHDKIILNGIACENAILDETGKINLEEFFKERTEKKLILFAEYTVTVDKTKKEVIVTVAAKKNKMKLNIEQKARIMHTEKRLRS